MPRIKSKLPVEQWKTLKNYGNYSVSNYGEVRNDKTGHVLKLFRPKTSKRLTVALPAPYGDRKQVRLRVDLLVAENFLPKVKGKTEVEPIDGDYSNLLYLNLRWVKDKRTSTYAYYQLSNQLGEKYEFSNKQQILDFLNVDQKEVSWQSLQQIAFEFGFELKRLEGTMHPQAQKYHKDINKAQEFKMRNLAFANYIDKKYPGGTPIDENDPVVIEHYRYVRKWKQ